jgi:hypothetical protein
MAIIGNIVEFITAAKDGAMHLLLAKWAQKYGEIIRVQVGAVTNFYLNSNHAVKVRTRSKISHELPLQLQ